MAALMCRHSDGCNGCGIIHCVGQVYGLASGVVVVCQVARYPAHGHVIDSLIGEKPFSCVRTCHAAHAPDSAVALIRGVKLGRGCHGYDYADQYQYIGWVKIKHRVKHHQSLSFFTNTSPAGMGYPRRNAGVSMRFFPSI